MATKKYEDMRSNWEFGEASECRKGLMCGMGYTVEEQKRPLIGVVNSWNEYNPGHVIWTSWRSVSSRASGKPAACLWK